MTPDQIVGAVIACWFIAGWLGSFIAFAVWWREELDVETADLWFGFVMGVVAGPLMLLVGLILAGTTVIGRALKRAGYRSSTVVWRRRAWPPPHSQRTRMRTEE